MQNSHQTIVLFDIDDVLFHTEHFKKSELKEYKLYEEVQEVLEKIEGLGSSVEIGILSQGDQEMQWKKLVQTGIHDRFVQEHIHIVDKKDENLQTILSKYTESNAAIYFIDDRLSPLYFAKKAVPNMTTVWLKRGRYAEGQDSIIGFDPDKIVYTLRELAGIITGIKY